MGLGMPKGVKVCVGGYCDVGGTVGVRTRVAWSTYILPRPQHISREYPHSSAQHISWGVPPAPAHPMRVLTLPPTPAQPLGVPLPQATAHFPGLPAPQGGGEIFILAVTGVPTLITPVTQVTPAWHGLGRSPCNNVEPCLAPTYNVGSAEA